MLALDEQYKAVTYPAASKGQPSDFPVCAYSTVDEETTRKWPKCWM